MLRLKLNHVSKRGPRYCRQCDMSRRSHRTVINTLGPRQNGRRFPDDIFKCIFLNENVWISLKISLKFVPKVPINNKPALIQTMAWRRPGDKPLSEPMMVRLLTHICVTRPQWVNMTTRPVSRWPQTLATNVRHRSRSAMEPHFVPLVHWDRFSNVLWVRLYLLHFSWKKYLNI